MPLPAPPIIDQPPMAVSVTMHIYAHQSIDPKLTRIFEEVGITQIYPDAQAQGSSIVVSLISNALMSPPELTLVVYKTDTLLSDTTSKCLP